MKKGNAMKTGYSYAINYFRKVEGQGWTFESFKTTDDAVRMHLRSLIRQKQSGQVRTIEMSRLK